MRAIKNPESVSVIRRQCCPAAASLTSLMIGLAVRRSHRPARGNCPRPSDRPPIPENCPHSSASGSRPIPWTQDHPTTSDKPPDMFPPLFLLNHNRSTPVHHEDLSIRLILSHRTIPAIRIHSSLQYTLSSAEDPYRPLDPLAA